MRNVCIQFKIMDGRIMDAWLFTTAVVIKQKPGSMPIDPPPMPQPKKESGFRFSS